MRLLDRYLLRELLIPLGYCLGGFLLFWMSFDLLGRMDEYRQLRLTGLDITAYYLAQIPEWLGTILPVALLLALLYALTTLARHHELTAMRAAGLSIWRLALPYLLLGTLFTLTVFLVNELWAPKTRIAAEHILHRRTRQAGDINSSRWIRQLAFLNERHHRLWNIGLYDRRTGTMYAPSVVWDEPDRGRRQVVAAQAVYTNGVWVFFNARQLRLNPYQLIQTNRLAIPELTETPEQIESEIVFNALDLRDATERAQLSLRQLLNYRRLHPHLHGLRRARLETQLHARLAEPWTCLVVVLMALPFAMPPGRRNVFVGVASSLFILFAYYVLLRFSLALGAGGYLPGFLAAWLPNLLFGTAGALLTHRLR